MDEADEVKEVSESSRADIYRGVQPTEGLGMNRYCDCSREKGDVVLLHGQERISFTVKRRTARSLATRYSVCTGIKIDRALFFLTIASNLCEELVALLEYD